MKFKMLVYGHELELVFDKIKEYPRFTLYQVSKLVDGVKVELYKECFSNFDISYFIKNGNRIPANYYG